MTDDQMHALQDQRHREALAVEMSALRAHAERARWCEEVKADVVHISYVNEWSVVWVANDRIRSVNATDRDAAIDRAREEGK